MNVIQKSDRYSSLAVLFGVIALLSAIGLGGLTKVYYDQTTARFERSTDKLLRLQTEIRRLLRLAPAGIFTDSGFSIYNDPDFLKMFCFDAEELTPDQKRTYTAPDANGTLALFSDIPTSFATTTPTYLTRTTDAGLLNERVLTMNNNSFTEVDLGPGGAFQVNLKDTGVVPGTYMRATLTVNAKGLVTNATSNISGNITCPSEFPDASFAIVSDLDLDAAVKFNVTDLTPAALRTMVVQPSSGVIAYLTDIVSVFPDDTFQIQNAAVSSKHIMFDCFNISSGFTRIMSIQNSNGIIAYLSQIPKTFADNVFAIFDQAVTNKRAMFKADAISPNTNRSYAFPNLSGDLLLTSGAQSLTDKIIQGPTNLVDADGLQTSGTAVDVSAAAPPTAGQILTTSVSTTAAIWKDVPTYASGNWTPVITLPGFLTPTTHWLIVTGPNVGYANYQRVDDIVFGSFTLTGISTADTLFTGPAVVNFNLPLPRSGNFPSSPFLASGIGHMSYVQHQNQFITPGACSIQPIAGTQLMQSVCSIDSHSLQKQVIFLFEFMYQL